MDRLVRTANEQNIIVLYFDDLETIRDRVGGGLTVPVLSHHRTYGSVYGGS